MFEDTLLIIKSDYMHKRKSVLLKLLQKDFQIQGHRKVLFSPEHAAEFYKDLAEDKNFMLQVILLSKGNAEAFILTKENAVEDLVKTMVCYFLTSMEMERNVHVSKSPGSVRREISFIFPNYIYEPIPYFEQPKFCQNPLMSPLVDELYDIIQGGGSGPSADLPNQNWRIKLSEWLTMSNKTLPHISNQCSRKPTIGHEEKGQQVGSSFKRLVCTDHTVPPPGSSRSPSLSLSSAGSSAMITSSSCITCSCFDGRSGEVCLHPPPHDPCGILKKRIETPPNKVVEESPPPSPMPEDEHPERESVEEECERQPSCETEVEEEFEPLDEGPPDIAIVVEDDEEQIEIQTAVGPSQAIELPDGTEVQAEEPVAAPDQPEATVVQTEAAVVQPEAAVVQPEAPTGKADAPEAPPNELEAPPAETAQEEPVTVEEPQPPAEE